MNQVQTNSSGISLIGHRSFICWSFAGYLPNTLIRKVKGPIKNLECSFWVYCNTVFICWSFAEENDRILFLYRCKGYQELLIEGTIAEKLLTAVKFANYCKATIVFDPQL